MRDKAYAKINLSLDITGKRPDGYHELNSIMVPIELWDDVKIYRAKEMKYVCNIPIPFNEKNTVVKAINYMKERFVITDNFKVIINKRVPTQAGLGGGSSDGAAVIRILNQMYHLCLSDEEIIKACLSIGADVPFTYYNRPAVVKGIGEKLEFFDIKKKKYVLLIKPRFGVSTKEAYETLNLNKCNHPDISKIKDALINGTEYEEYLANSLEEPAYRLCQAISEIKNELNGFGYDYPLMSGSGSTVFVLSDSRHDLIRLKKEFHKKYAFTYVTSFLI